MGARYINLNTGHINKQQRPIIYNTKAFTIPRLKKLELTLHWDLMLLLMQEGYVQPKYQKPHP